MVTMEVIPYSGKHWWDKSLHSECSHLVFLEEKTLANRQIMANGY